MFKLNISGRLVLGDFISSVFFPSVGVFMAAFMVEEKTKEGIERLLRASGGESAPRRIPGSPARWVIVRCDSATPIGVATDTTKDQLYPCTVVYAASFFRYPPLGALDTTMTGTKCLMTLLGADAEAVVPVEGNVYGGILTGDVEIDPDASGSLAKRPRVVVPEGDGFTNPLTDKGDLLTHDGTGLVRLPVGTDFQLLAANSSESEGLQWLTPSAFGFGDVFSSSSSSADNAVARFDGAFGHTIQNSLVIISDVGAVSTPAVLGFTSSASAGAGGTLSYNAFGGFHSMPGLTCGLATGSNSVRSTFSVHPWFSDTSGGNVWLAQSFSAISGVDTPKDTYVVAETGFGVGTLAPGSGLWTTLSLGVTGTLGPGATSIGGMINNLGSGSFVGTATVNAFTNTNTFHPSTDIVPLTTQGSASQTADLFQAKNNAGTVLAKIDASGNLTAVGLSGAGVNLTIDCGTW